MPKALKIKAQTDGFRRAGHAFSSTEEKTLLLSDLTKEQIEALKNEPKLLVVEADVVTDVTFANEAVEKLATEAGLKAEDVEATGKGGSVITKADVEKAIAKKKQ